MSSRKLRAKSLRVISILEEDGLFLREPESKYLRDGIFELRAHFRNDVTRILYFFYDKEKIVLTNGFIKKTRRTPRQKIERAVRYRAEYIERKGKL